MKLAHTILAGAALAVSMAGTASAADLLLGPPDPIYNSPLFDFEGLYVGGTGGVAASGDLQGIGAFGTWPTTAKATAGLLWHVN